MASNGQQVAVGGLSGAVVVAVVVAVVLVLRGSGTTVPDPPLPPPSSTVAAPTTPVSPDETAGWDALLAAQAATDAPTVEASAERWVPQLGSKTTGLDVGGIVYRPSDIWTDFTTLRTAHPDAVLLDSDGWSSFRNAGYWVTVNATSYPTAEEANAWCDAQGLPAGDCFAKLLSHTAGPEGASVFR